MAPIVRDTGGKLRLGPLSTNGKAAGTGETIEWAVVMRRFRREDLFDRLAEVILAAARRHLVEEEGRRGAVS